MHTHTHTHYRLYTIHYTLYIIHDTRYTNITSVASTWWAVTVSK